MNSDCDYTNRSGICDFKTKDGTWSSSSKWWNATYGWEYNEVWMRPYKPKTCSPLLSLPTDKWKNSFECLANQVCLKNTIENTAYKIRQRWQF